MSNHLFDALFPSTLRSAAPFILEPDGRTWTYGDTLAASARLAGRLVQLGVKPGDRVAAQVDKCAEALMLYLAVLRVGAVYLPLNTAYTPAEMDYFLGDAEPALVAVSPGALAEIGPVAARHGSVVETLRLGGGSLIEGAQALADRFETVARGSDDLAAILYTSGTTGRSKGAMLSHGNLCSNAEVLRHYWRFSAADRLIHALPIFHTHGLFVATNVILLAGASMWLMPRFDADAVLDLMAESSVLMGVPTFYTRLVQHPRLSPEAVARMRVFISGSAPLLDETHAAFAARTGHAILERYGMTETGMNTSNPYDGRRLAGSVGFALPGIDVRVATPDGLPMAPGETGMIEVRGPNVFGGYWRMPEKTKEELRSDGFFITGDLGRFDEAGYLHIVGRSKDLIISAGLNVYPKEVEAEIDAIPGVVESAVVGMPHADLGEAVTAVVVRRSEATDEAVILEALRPRLARFKVPRRVVFVADLPRNSMGKVQKNLIRADLTGLYGKT